MPPPPGSSASGIALIVSITVWCVISPDIPSSAVRSEAIAT